jgi:GNAT superfamily N-acetyltransferase
MENKELTIHRLDPSRRDDFFRLHSKDHGCDWCYCIAWWMTTWDGFQDRTAEENRCLREDLFDVGEYDGYLLYADDEPVGWCQAGPRDRLELLVQKYNLPPDPDAWAITCFQIVPRHRRKGLATRLLSEVLQDLRRRGVKRVEAYPNRGENLDAEDLWNGPEAMFAKVGFKMLREDPRGPVMNITL